MQNIILCSNLYNDGDSLSALISNMEYESTPYGSEIKNFNFLPQGLEQQFSSLLNMPVEVQPNTGVFRKPNAIVHFEPFYQHCLWVCIVALEDTVLTLHEKDDIKTVFDVPNEKMEEVLLSNDWTETNKINIRKNEFVLIRPWLWHSLQEEKLVQVFLLNHRLEREDG